MTRDSNDKKKMPQPSAGLGMMSLDDELAAAMAEAAAAVSAPRKRRPHDTDTAAAHAPVMTQRLELPEPSGYEPPPREIEPQVAPAPAGVDLDLLGALDAAISGSWQTSPNAVAPAEGVPSGPSSPQPVVTLKPQPAPQLKAAQSPTATTITTDDSGADTPDKASAEAPAEAPAEAASDSMFEDSMFEDSMFEASAATEGSASGDAEADSSTHSTSENVEAQTHDEGAAGGRSSPTESRELSAPAQPRDEAEPAVETVVAAGDSSSDASSKDTEQSELERQALREAAVLDALAAWMQLIKVCAAPRADAAMAQVAARKALGQLQAVDGAWSAELRGQTWFLDDAWLPVPARHAVVLRELNAALHRAQRSGVWMTVDANAEQLLEVTQAFVLAVRGKGDSGLNEAKEAGFTRRPALEPNAESWAASIVRRCVDVADITAGEGPFPESMTIELLDELSQAIPAQLGAVLRAQELRGTTWTAPWATTSTMTLTLATLLSAGASPRITRSATLAVWALVLAAHRGERPPSLPILADRASRRFAPLTGQHNWSPVSVAARGMLRRFAGNEDPQASVTGLIQLMYDIHAARLAGAPHLLAAVAGLTAHVKDPWVPRLLRAVGPIPVGTPVRLPDGRKGVVVDLAGQTGPLRPLVQIGATMVRPSADVALLAPDP